MADLSTAAAVVKDPHVAVRQKRLTITKEDKAAQIVYMRGADSTLSNINPLAIQNHLKVKVGEIDKIYKAGGSLKVYCKSKDQKLLDCWLLKRWHRSTWNVLKKSSRVAVTSARRNATLKTERCVISGVPEDI